MNASKQISGRSNFSVQKNLTSTLLAFDGYKVGSYPLTYSVVDCLEHFCDWAGWELYSLHYHYECINSTTGSATMKRPFKTRSFAATFCKARTLFRRGLVET